MRLRRIPSLNWLRVFEAAARLGSFARAGRMLNMSAPAVSQQIQALESHLGKKLFKRGARHVELTDAGRDFLPVVSQAIGEMEATATALFGAEDVETITLQTILILAMSWLPDQIRRFEAAHPGLRINVLTDEQSGVATARAAPADPDIWIGFGPRAHFPEHAIPLMGEQIWPLARRDIALQIAQNGVASDQRVLEIGAHHAGWRHVAALWPDLDFASAQVRMVDNTPLALMMAAQGLGLALQRAPASLAMAEALELAPIDGAPQLVGLQRYYLIRKEERLRRRSVRLLQEWLVEAAAAESKNGLNHK